MSAVFRWLVSHRTAAYLLTATLLLLGLSELPTIKRDVYPSVDLDEVHLTPLRRHALREGRIDVHHALIVGQSARGQGRQAKGRNWAEIRFLRQSV